MMEGNTDIPKIMRETLGMAKASHKAKGSGKVSPSTDNLVKVRMEIQLLNRMVFS